MFSICAENSRQRISSSSSQDDINGGAMQTAKTKKRKSPSAEKSNNRLFSKSVVLKLLAELTKSYPIVARLITDHVFASKGNDKTSKVRIFMHSVFLSLFDQIRDGQLHGTT